MIIQRRDGRASYDTLPRAKKGMKRMADINAKLTALVRNEKLTFIQREAKAGPLRDELAELHEQLWGDRA